MKLKTMLYAVGALALAACDSPTVPRTADPEAEVVGSQPPIVRLAPPQRIAFTSARDGNNEIYMMNQFGGGLTRLTNNPADDGEPALSPDGKKVAFTSTRDGNREIYVMNADGTGVPVNLTHNPADDRNPAWSPDGTKLAFSSDRDGSFEIHVMNADGSGIQQRTSGVSPNSYMEPAWSPDGTKIAFTNYYNSYSDVYAVNASGPVNSGFVRLTNDGHWNRQPAWSPNGLTIAFQREYDVYVMNANGSGMHFLYGTFSYFEGEPAWSPDGTQIAFTRYPGIIDVINATDGSWVRRLTTEAVLLRGGPSWGGPP